MRNYGCALMVAVCVLGFYAADAAAQQGGDEVAIQKLIDALGPEGGTVELEARTYILRNTVRLEDYVIVKGAGVDKTIIKIADGVNRAAFSTKRDKELEHTWGNHDLAILDLTIDGNADNNEKHSEGIKLPNCYAYRIENVHVKNSRGLAGIITWPCHAAKREKIAYKNYIVNCVVDGNQHAKAYDFPEGGGYGHGFYVTAWDNDNVLFRNNVARNNKGSGIHGEDFIEYFFVEDCESYGNRGPGIWFCEVANSVIRNCKIYENGGDGISCGQGKGNYNNLICQNEIRDNGGRGIVVGKGYDPGTSRFVIISNVIKNNKQDSHIYIQGSAAENVIAFNFCYLEEGRKPLPFGIIADSTGNLIINNYVGGVSEEFKAVDGNVVVPWDYDKPWTPENLVSTY